MNIGVVFCIIMAAFFGVLTIVFSWLKERGAILVSGFNSLPKGERAQYDQVRISKDMRNNLFLWTAIYAAGAILAAVLGSYAAIGAFIVWLFVFFREVHLDPKKAFAKYRK